MEKLNKTTRKHKHLVNKKISVKTIPEQLPGKPVKVRLGIEKEVTTAAVIKETISPRPCLTSHRRQHPSSHLVPQRFLDKHLSYIRTCSMSLEYMVPLNTL